MQFVFCKKSVFCALFLIFFLLGTICGILLFRSILKSDYLWLCFYCRLLEQYLSGFSFASIFYLLLPFFVLYFVSLLPSGEWFVLGIVFLRGCIFSYFTSAAYFCSVSSRPLMFAALFLFPLFAHLSHGLFCSACDRTN